MEIQSLEQIYSIAAYRGLANSFVKSGEMEKAINVFERTPEIVAFGEISSNRKKVYWQERLDSYMKIGDYNSFRYPVLDFPSSISRGESEITPEVWLKFIEQYEMEIGDEVVKSELAETKNFEKQFKLVGKSLNRIF